MHITKECCDARVLEKCFIQQLEVEQYIQPMYVSLMHDQNFQNWSIFNVTKFSNM